MAKARGQEMCPELSLLGQKHAGSGDGRSRHGGVRQDHSFGIWVILCSLSGSTGNSKPALLKGLSNQPVSPMNFSSQASALFAVNCVQSQEKSHSTCSGICMHCKGFEAGTVLWWFVLAAFRAQRPGWGTPARQTLTNGCPLQPLRDEASCLLLGR